VGAQQNFGGFFHDIYSRQPIEKTIFTPSDPKAIAN
jgi:hypothetical protein